MAADCTIHAASATRRDDSHAWYRRAISPLRIAAILFFFFVKPIINHSARKNNATQTVVDKHMLFNELSNTSTYNTHNFSC